MALIKCPKCGKEISDTLNECNFCGMDFEFYKKHPKLLLWDTFAIQNGASTEDVFDFIFPDKYDYNDKKPLKIKYKDKSFEFNFKDRNTIHLFNLFNDSLTELVNSVKKERKFFVDDKAARAFYQLNLKSLQLYFADLVKYSVDKLDADVNTLTKIVKALTDYIKSFGEKQNKALNKAIDDFNRAKEKYNANMEENRMQYIGDVVKSRVLSYEVSPSLGLASLSRAGSKFEKNDKFASQVLSADLNNALEACGDTIFDALVDTSKNVMLTVTALLTSSNNDLFNGIPLFKEKELNDLLDNPYEFLKDNYNKIEINREDLINILEYFDYKDKVLNYYVRKMDSEILTIEELESYIDVYAYLKDISQQEVFNKFIKKTYIENLEKRIDFISHKTYNLYKDGILDKDINYKYLTEEEKNRLQKLYEDKIKGAIEKNEKNKKIKKIVIIGLIAAVVLFIVVKVTITILHKQELQIVGKYWCTVDGADRCIRINDKSLDFYTKMRSGKYKKETVPCGHFDSSYSSKYGESYTLFIGFENYSDGQLRTVLTARTEIWKGHARNVMDIDKDKWGEDKYNKYVGLYELVKEEPIVGDSSEEETIDDVIKKIEETDDSDEIMNYIDPFGLLN